MCRVQHKSCPHRAKKCRACKADYKCRTCIAAEKLFESGKTVSAGELVPNYLRLAQAEREKLQKEGKL